MSDWDKVNQNLRAAERNLKITVVLGAVALALSIASLILRLCR